MSDWLTISLDDLLRSWGPNPLAKYVGHDPAFAWMRTVEQLRKDIALRKSLRKQHRAGSKGHAHYSQQIAELGAIVERIEEDQRQPLFKE